MAFTTGQIAALEAAIAAGILTVKTGDELVTYQSVADMLKVLQIMKAEVNGTGTRRTVVTFSNGTRNGTCR